MLASVKKESDCIKQCINHYLNERLRQIGCCISVITLQGSGVCIGVQGRFNFDVIQC